MEGVHRPAFSEATRGTEDAEMSRKSGRQGSAFYFEGGSILSAARRPNAVAHTAQTR